MPPVFCSRTDMRVLSASRGSGAAMRITFGTTLIVCAITCVWSLPAPAAPPLRQLQTRDLQLVWFHPAEDYLAPYAARAFENSMQWQKRTWGWTPDGKVNVLLKDFGDYGNAGARSTPNNALIVDIAPFSYSFETFVASERIFSLMNHELVHVANMDQATRTDLRWRHALGGKIQVDAQHPETLLYRYLTVPRTVVPRWYLEGIAVFFETWMSGGRGRAQGAYDEMVFRAMVRDHARFYDPEGLAAEGTKVDFQVGVNNYLYGTRFVSYLGLKYSPQKVVEWAARHEGSRRYYADQFHQVFGRTLNDAWADWIAWEHGFQDQNLAAIARYPVTHLQPLSHVALGSISRAFYDPDRDAMIAGFRYPGVAAYIGIMSLKDGRIRHLVDVKGPMLYKVTSLAWDPASKTAFYTTDNNSGYRDVMALDTVSGQTHMLLKDARIGDLVFDRSDRSHTAVNGDQSLYLLHREALDAADAKPFASFNFGTAVPEGFVFAPDGLSLYGSSYYTGVSNIYRYTIASGRIEALSNAQTGLFRPLPLPDGRMLAFDYTGQGFIPGYIDAKPREDLAAITFLGAQIADRHPIVKAWNVGPPSQIDLDKMIVSRGDYRPVREIRQQALYPIVQGYKDSWALGMHGTWSDPIGLDHIIANAAYSPDGSLPKYERIHFDAQWENLGVRIGYKHNGASFYDLFGPTKVSLRGNEWLTGYKRALIFDVPRTLDLDLSLHVFNGLDNVDDEKGIRWNLNLVSKRANGMTVPALYGGVDLGWPFLFKHSSFWLRTSAGAAGGNANNPYRSEEH